MKLPAVSRLILSLLAILSFCGCPSSPPTQIKVPVSDSTPPGGLWLQADIPGQPLLNASPGAAPSSETLKDDAPVHLTARADDSDGGVKEVRIFMSYSRSKLAVIEGPRSPERPQQKTPAAPKLATSPT